MSNLNHTLWVEKYRPSSLSDYVFKDNKFKKLTEKWIQEKSIGHICLTGGPGVGKTTLAKALLADLGVEPFDIKEINGSKDNGVDFIRNTIDNFSTLMPFGDYKYILLDEADMLSFNAQACLRNAMEVYSNTTRFILTANYQNKIIPAIMSRCQHIHIDTLDKNDFTTRIATVLLSEEVDFDLDVLDTFVAASFPDMRKCINLCQQNTIDKKLELPDSKSNTSDYRLEAIELFKSGNYKEARLLICKQVQPEEYDEIYRFMYQNLDLWADDDSQKEEAILIIRDGLIKHGIIADPEINLSATFIQLSNMGK
jgi:replication factor C small subunit